MSHIRSALVFLFVQAFVCAGLIYSAPAAHAAVVADRFEPVKASQTHRAKLSELTHGTYRILDWRSPATTIRFDVPPGAFTDKVVLSLSASPQDGVSAATPLMVRLNNDTPIAVHAEGYRFDAQIELPTNRLRARNNIIEIRYKTPSGQDCLSEAHGSWTVDLARSSLTLKSRSRSRALQIGEIDDLLKSPMTAPRRVAIIARGEQSLTYKALAAQGIGLRMDDIPDFSENSRNSQFRIMIGTRKDLTSQLRGSDIPAESGPRFAILPGTPATLVITGDQEAEVLEAVRLFAQRALPAARRASVAAGELHLQSPLSPAHLDAGSKIALSALGQTDFDFNYRPEPLILSFSTTDTRHSKGVLQLELLKNDTVENQSRMDVVLNGQALGFTFLDKRKKRVAFDIPAGALRADFNELKLIPTLNARSASCLAYSEKPGIALGRRSFIELGAGLDQASLSSFAAGGSAFTRDYAANTTVILPNGGNSVDFHAALQVMAIAARTHGAGWTNALYKDEVPLVAKDRNYLFVGRADIPSTLGGQLPTSLAPSKRLDPKMVQAYEIAPQQLASLDTVALARVTPRLPASSSAQAALGYAALFPTGQGHGLAAIINAKPGTRLPRAVNALLADRKWGKLSGQVSLWTHDDIEIVQIGGVKIEPATLPAPAPKTPQETLPLWSKAKDMFTPARQQAATPITPVKPAAIIQARLRGRAAPDLTLAADIQPAREPLSKSQVIISERQNRSPNWTARIMGPDWSWQNVKLNAAYKFKALKAPRFTKMDSEEIKGTLRKGFNAAVMSKSFWLLSAALLLIVLIGGSKPSAHRSVG